MARQRGAVVGVEVGTTGGRTDTVKFRHAGLADLEPDRVHDRQSVGGDLLGYDTRVGTTVALPIRDQHDRGGPAQVEREQLVSRGPQRGPGGRVSAGGELVNCLAQARIRGVDPAVAQGTRATGAAKPATVGIGAKPEQGARWCAVQRLVDGILGTLDPGSCPHRRR